MQFSLYIVSTPIGNLKDITVRGKELLQCVDYVLCEDTRVSEKLLKSVGVKARFIVYNDYNSKAITPKIVKKMKVDCKKYALISDAGTPLISDPGYELVNACIDHGVKYTVIPGSCAAIAALTLSGLPSDRFLFAGFVDHRKFKELSKVNATLIFYESPRRVLKTLKVMKDYFSTRTIAVVREITKIHEELRRNDVNSLIAYFESNAPKGEFVIIVSPPGQDSVVDKLYELKPLIDELVGKISVRDLSEILSRYTKMSKNAIYKFLSNYQGR
ncbi:MAG: 16S rRNA (cytidine(1402)-2'-O)-methyltransferase [Holosporales bacterium]|jgi:16S rRNA (cytidine1402-2'-O)-methyltransferase|nr:16S rRNA (cytidine(1402)-2'-O)-methyltransferase [Holosporales bacterium]